MEQEPLTHKIIACAYKVYNTLGFGFLESVYHKALLIELRKAGLRAESEKPLEIIAEIVSRIAGKNAEIYLFGSRLNDQARGGDIDMVVEVEERLERLERARMKMELERGLGLPVDILIHVRNTEGTPFQRIARANAKRLEAYE